MKLFSLKINLIVLENRGTNITNALNVIRKHVRIAVPWTFHKLYSQHASLKFKETYIESGIL